MDTQPESANAEARYRHAAGTVFRALRAQRGWSLREFGERVGAAHTSLYTVERGESTPGIDMLDRVAGAFDMTLSALLSLIVDELHRESGEADGSLAELIVAFSQLTPAERAEAVNYMEYLRFRAGKGRTD